MINTFFLVENMKIPTSASKSDFKLVSTQTVYHTGIYFNNIDVVILSQTVYLFYLTIWRFLGTGFKVGKYLQLDGGRKGRNQGSGTPYL